MTRRSISGLLASTQAHCKTSACLRDQPLPAFPIGDSEYSLPRFIFHGPYGGDQPIRIGIFPAIHGDEAAAASGVLKFVELLNLSPELARDFSLFIYPLCNPTGYEDNSRFS